MKYSTSSEKMAMIHRALDRQLQIVGCDEKREQGKLSEDKTKMLANITNRPPAYQTVIKETEIVSKRNQITELERKLMALQKKMETISVSSDQSSNKNQKKSRGYPEIDKVQKEITITKNTKQPASVQNIRKGSVEILNRSLSREARKQQDEQSEDSQDYFQIQKAIQKRKEAMRVSNTFNTQKSKHERAQSAKSKRSQEINQLRATIKAENDLKSKYPTVVQDKDSLEEKRRSKRQQSQPIKSKLKDQIKLSRASSKKSVKSSNSLKKENLKSRNSSSKRENLRSNESESNNFTQNKDIGKGIRQSNVQKQLQHYKRLAKKHRQQLQQYRVMEIEFKQLKKNFAKSQLIRAQQKKIIEALKLKAGR